MSRSGTYDPEYGFIPDEDVPQEPKPQTNADRIRAMTGEDLAEWIADILHCHGRLYANRDAYECPSECPLWNCCKEPPGSISGWLKQEVDR